jgi:hypothetical protein
MPLNPDMSAFLAKLPCMVCRQPSEIVIIRENKHGLPSCADGGCMFRLAEERADLERFAYELTLIAGDIYTATNKILFAHERLFK